MCGGGGDDLPAGVSTPQQIQQAADSGTPISPEQAKFNSDTIHSAEASGPIQQTDFFGNNYNVATAIDPSIPGFSLGDSGTFSPSGAGGGGISSGITPGSLGGSIGGPAIGSFPGASGSADASGSSSLDDIASGSSSVGSGAGSLSPPSFGGVQSFGGPSFSSSSDNFSSPSITNLASAAAGGSDQPISGFESPSGGAGNLSSFGGFGGTSNADFPDPTSSASSANSGGVPDNTQPYDPFGNTVQGKDQSQVPQGVPGLPPGAADANASAQPSDIASLTAGAASPSLAPGASGIPNYSGTPITQLAATDSSGNPSSGPYGSNPFTPYGTTNPAYGDNTATGTAEAYPGQNSTTNSAPKDQSALGQLANSFGLKNPIGAAVAGAAGLYSVLNGKSTSASGIANLQSSIPQIQSVIGQVQAQAAQLSSEAATLKSQGGSIVNSTSPISEQSKQLMSYVSSGQLPPAYQTQVDEGIKAAKAAALSNAAARGQNVSPGPNGDYAGNTSLQAQLQSIDRQGVILSQTLAKTLYDAGVAGIGAANQTISAGTGIIQAGNSDQANATALQAAGLNGLNIQNRTYQEILNAQKQQSALTGQAIALFANALGGGGGGTTIKVGGSPSGT